MIRVGGILQVKKHIKYNKINNNDNNINNNSSSFKINHTNFVNDSEKNDA